MFGYIVTHSNLCVALFASALGPKLQYLVIGYMIMINPGYTMFGLFLCWGPAGEPRQYLIVPIKNDISSLPFHATQSLM